MRNSAHVSSATSGSAAPTAALRLAWILRSIPGMHFEIIGAVRESETIATGSGIRDLARLRKAYGPGRWRKRKGIARIQIGGVVREAEIHWYEATGIGKREYKIKRFLD